MSPPRRAPEPGPHGAPPDSVDRMSAQPYLDAINDRIIVFDGAFGTFIQALDLSADDFGGPTLEGCNEMLCLTRPDVIAQMHDDFFAVGRGRGGDGQLRLLRHRPERVRHRRPQTYELNVASARIAREVASGWPPTAGRGYVAGSIGPGTKLPSLGHIRFANLARRL